MIDVMIVIRSFSLPLICAACQSEDCLLRPTQINSGSHSLRSSSHWWIYICDEAGFWLTDWSQRGKPNTVTSFKSGAYWQKHHDRLEGNVCIKCEMWVETWLRVLVSRSCAGRGRCDNEIEGALSAYREGMPQQKPLSLFCVAQICPGTKAWLSALLAPKCVRQSNQPILIFSCICKFVCLISTWTVFLFAKSSVQALTFSHEMSQD